MDVVIAGAGVIGCAVARELAGRGVGCTLVDDRVPGGGATQASAGMLAPYVEAHEQGPLRDLGVRSLALYDEWIESVRRESGLDVEYRRIGTLEVALDPSHAADLQAAARQNEAAGARWTDGARTRAGHPALGSVAGALFTPAHGYVSAPELTGALLAAARQRGARVLRARVTRIGRDDGRLQVTTTAGTLPCDQAIVAAGAWSSGIEVGSAGAPPLRPVRGQLLHLGWHGHPLDTIVWGPECYVVPRVDGTVLVGATVEDVGFDERATSAGVRDLLDAACELLPEGWGASFLGVRVGLRPATPDDLPVLGPDPRVPGLTYATGHYRNGILLAPITARAVADWIVQGTRDGSFDALTVERFR